MVTVTWKGEMAFEANPPSEIPFIMDADSDGEAIRLGPSPLETLLGAIGGCSGMDVVSILKKKQQKVTGYRIEVSGERGPAGVFPRPYLSITLRHVVTGENLDPVAVARSVELSDTKYCSVIQTLRLSPEVKSEWHIES